MSRFIFEMPGWENGSVWGWDPPMSEWYVQLWRNETSTNERPDWWLTGPTSPRGVPVPGIPESALRTRIVDIAAVTGASVPAVVAALAYDISDDEAWSEFERSHLAWFIYRYQEHLLTGETFEQVFASDQRRWVQNAVANRSIPQD